MTTSPRARAILSSLWLFVAACGGGGSGSDSDPDPDPTAGPSATAGIPSPTATPDRVLRTPIGGGKRELPDEVRFFFNPGDAGGGVTCDGGTPITTVPATCTFGTSGELTVGRVGWGRGVAILEKSGNAPTGACRESLIHSATVDGDFNLLEQCAPNDAQARATGELLVDDWITDLPWHQKLSTVHSNLIDVPFVLPFDAIRFDDLPEGKRCASAATPTEKARCMLEYGIVNVVAMHRTDTLYKPGEEPEGQQCDAGDCVEVKLEVQRFHSRTDDPSGREADVIKNNAVTLPSTVRVPSLGFAITEATLFAPWRPWYMGHYCGVTDAIIDSVCYDDYFTTQLQASVPKGTNEKWLDDYAAIFDPRGEGEYLRFCQAGQISCSMYLGKVDRLPELTAPKVVAGGCSGESEQTCEDEIAAKTKRIDDQFNGSIVQFADIGRFPWGESTKSAAELESSIPTNPFIGFYELERYSSNGGGSVPSSLFKAPSYVLPKRCTKLNFLGARQGKAEDIAALKECALDVEIHSSGFHEAWEHLYGRTLTPDDVQEIGKALPGIDANQYGRTMFLLAGIGEQKIPVSYRLLDDGMSLHDKMYGSSVFTQYLPMVNPADQTLLSRSYQNDFWHAFFMSNHMNQEPDHFFRGLRGRTLWHNEYRSKKMYDAAEVLEPRPIAGTPFEGKLDPVDFPAGFQVGNHTSPFHGNTCDSCHVRNGSGIPLMPNGELSPLHVGKGMTAHYVIKSDINGDSPDYTYTNFVVPPEANSPGSAIRFPSMKMVLFDLDAPPALEQCDVDDHTIPLTPLHSDDFYSNKVMNFHGNSFHVNQENDSTTPGRRLPTYEMGYVPITDGSGFEIVDETTRGSFQPMRVAVSAFDTGSRCSGAGDIAAKPSGVDAARWPASCADVSGDAVAQAIEAGEIGFMHLLGRRLGNTPLIEMIPDRAIIDAQTAQATTLTHAGCFGLAPGTRAGDIGLMNYRSCASGLRGTGAEDCYISRWGWVGDRASLEDQVANAASVEMNITSTEGYDRAHADPADQKQLVRYDETVCGPADAACRASRPNSDLTEQEIRDMATYQRWIGIPQRSEYQVSSAIVQEGETVFKGLKCDSCHVIRKIPFVEDDNMLPDEQRFHLKNLQILAEGGEPDYPFVSYLGTDLLLHDMGYLSQVAKAPSAAPIRNADGTVKPEYAAYVQRIRTPALKGLRFNQFVTDSNHNTTNPLRKTDDPADQHSIVPGCDFLLHDGRACDAIEAAYLHDGPAIKKLGTIEALNALTEDQRKALRAFLYSL